MLREVIKFLNIKPSGLYVDSTFGLGGHTYEILKYLNRDGKLFVFDRDFNSYDIARKLSFFDCRVSASCMSFNNMFHVLGNVEGGVSGIVTDLGLSSFQLKDSSKGFGFNNDSFLDMRLNVSQSFRAIDWINFATQADLDDVFNFFGDKFIARRVVKRIIVYRRTSFIKTSRELYDLLIGIFDSYKFDDFISRVFQAIRIFINNDLSILNSLLRESFYLLETGGFLIVITFNSLEDRVVKNFFIDNNASLKFKFMYIKPSILEIGNNYSARSAIMRIIKKL